MDFGIIDTTPSHGFKVACIHSTPQTQHFTTTLRTRRLFDASVLQAAPAIAARHSHRARLVLILDFVFWAARASARRNNPHYLLSAAHVNQKSFDMTTPNDTRCALQQTRRRAYRSRVARMVVTRDVLIQIEIAK
jgi:hypothetical protein